MGTIQVLARVVNERMFALMKRVRSNVRNAIVFSWVAAGLAWLGAYLAEDLHWIWAGYALLYVLVALFLLYRGWAAHQAFSAYSSLDRPLMELATRISAADEPGMEACRTFLLHLLSSRVGEDLDAYVESTDRLRHDDSLAWEWNEVIREFGNPRLRVPLDRHSPFLLHLTDAEKDGRPLRMLLGRPGDLTLLSDLRRTAYLAEGTVGVLNDPSRVLHLPVLEQSLQQIDELATALTGPPRTAFVGTQSIQLIINGDPRPIAAAPDAVELQRDDIVVLGITIWRSNGAPSSPGPDSAVVAQLEVEGSTESLEVEHEIHVSSFPLRPTSQIARIVTSDEVAEDTAYLRFECGTEPGVDWIHMHTYQDQRMIHSFGFRVNIVD